MSFESEMSAGFAELAREAGIEVKFGSIGLAVVPDGGSPEQLRADLRMGTVSRTRLLIARAVVASLSIPPKIGDEFTYSGRRLRIQDVEDDDPSDPTITYLVKVWK